MQNITEDYNTVAEWRFPRDYIPSDLTTFATSKWRDFLSWLSFMEPQPGKTSTLQILGLPKEWKITNKTERRQIMYFRKRKKEKKKEKMKTK